MKTTAKRVIPVFFFVILASLLVACADSNSPAATLPVGNQVMPTDTPAPTSTPVPTWTPTMPVALVATPTAASFYFRNGEPADLQNDENDLATVQAIYGVFSRGPAGNPGAKPAGNWVYDAAGWSVSSNFDDVFLDKVSSYYIVGLIVRNNGANGRAFSSIAPRITVNKTQSSYLAPDYLAKQYLELANLTGVQTFNTPLPSGSFKLIYGVFGAPSGTPSLITLSSNSPTGLIFPLF